MFLIARARTHVTQTAIVDATGAYTYGDLLSASDLIARQILNRLGESSLAGRPITFVAEPGFEYVAIQWAIWRTGGIAVPLGTMHPATEWLYVAEDTSSPLCCYTANFDRIAGIEEWPAACVRWQINETLQTAKTTDAASELAIPVPDDQGAMILYTSGTTSRPKGVVLTHDNLLAQIECLVEAWGWTSADHILHVLPLHHVHGLVNALACPLYIGATCEFMPFDPASVWNRWQERGLTLFMAVPTIYARLIAAYDGAVDTVKAGWSRAASTLRLMVSGSAALPVSVLEKWESITGHRLLERYGMTEIGMALSNPLDGERVAGCVGRPLPGVDVKLVAEDGQTPDAGAAGEIHVRGRNVFPHYWRRPDATSESFTADGWFKTGDVATCESGVYRILGRSSVDIIKTGGYKVSALEVEEVLRRHNAIDNCAVVGVEDETWGEIICVAAVCNSPLDLAAIREWSSHLLAPYKTPRQLIVVDQLPCNAMGKVTKPAVKELFV